MKTLIPNDIVRINDYSYSFALRDGEMIYTGSRGPHGCLIDPHAKVIRACGLVLPSQNEEVEWATRWANNGIHFSVGGVPTNDTLILRLEDKMFFFISHLFLEKVNNEEKQV
jgi:hypothetical protein